MNPHRPHKHLPNGLRLVCLIVAWILMAGPALTTVSALAACNGHCCCCSDSGRPPVTGIAGLSGPNVGCCDPQGSVPCEVSAVGQPGLPPAWALPHRDSQVERVGAVLSRSLADNLTQQHQPPLALTDTDVAIGSPPLYLQVCRLIC